MVNVLVATHYPLFAVVSNEDYYYLYCCCCCCHLNKTIFALSLIVHRLRFAFSYTLYNEHMITGPLLGTGSVISRCRST